MLEQHVDAVDERCLLGGVVLGVADRDPLRGTGSSPSVTSHGPSTITEVSTPFCRGAWPRRRPTWPASPCIRRRTRTSTPSMRRWICRRPQPRSAKPSSLQTRWGGPGGPRAETESQHQCSRVAVHRELRARRPRLATAPAGRPNLLPACCSSRARDGLRSVAGVGACCVDRERGRDHDDERDRRRRCATSGSRCASTAPAAR